MDVVNICKALSDKQRYKIICMLKDGEMCGCKLLEELHISQPTLSHHMKILNECHLINDNKVGKWHHYSLNNEVISEFLMIINQLGG